MQPTELVALGALVMALVAVIAVVATVSSANKSRKDETLLMLYRLWLTVDAETGRHLLYQMVDQADVQDLWDHDRASWHRMNRALAVYQVLVEMVELKRIDTGSAGQLWGERIRLIWPKAVLFISWRRAVFDDGAYRRLEEFATTNLMLEPVPVWRRNVQHYGNRRSR